MKTWSSDSSELDALADRPLAREIREIALSGDVDPPSPPELALKIFWMIQHEDRADADEIADLIRTDPAISAALLKVANSAFYGGLSPVTELSQAVSRLGLRRVGSMVSTAVYRGQFETNDPVKLEILESLWGTAVATAVGSWHLARGAGVDTEEAYLTGLFLNIGKLFCLRAMDHKSARDPEFVFEPHLLDEVASAVHVELGHVVLTAWRLPEPICDALQNQRLPVSRIEDPLTLCSRGAVELIRGLAQDKDGEEAEEPLETPALDRLGLDPERAEMILETVAAELSGIRVMF